jgi:hypothetical protein
MADNYNTCNNNNNYHYYRSCGSWTLLLSHKIGNLQTYIYGLGIYYWIESQNHPVEENQWYWSYARCTITTPTTTTATVGIAVPYPWFSLPQDR